ncbi:MAG: hypothetical protein V3S43_06280 [Acidimicrobiia bacterium]
MTDVAEVVTITKPHRRVVDIESRQRADLRAAQSHPLFNYFKPMAGSLLVTSPHRQIYETERRSESGKVILPEMSRQHINEFGVIVTVVRCGRDCEEIRDGDQVMIPMHCGYQIYDWQNNSLLDLWVVDIGSVMVIIDAG